MNVALMSPPGCNLISVQTQLLCDGLRSVFREYREENSTVKSKENTRQGREKVELFHQGWAVKRFLIGCVFGSALLHATLCPSFT